MEDRDVISENLISNFNILKEMFHYPLNADLAVRELHINSINKDSILLYINGIINEDTIDGYIIKPLIENTIATSEVNSGIDLIKNILQPLRIKKKNKFLDVAKDLLDGKTILLISGYSEVLSVNTLKYEHRSIEESKSESIVKGPHESFVESATINRSLIRKSLKNRNLITESIEIGTEDNCEIHLMYKSNTVNPELVKEVRDRIKKIKEDGYNGIITSSTLQQYIEDNSISIVPTIMLTELPDRAVSFIKEGHIVILADNASSCLIVPATFWSFFHTPEDMYHRWIAGNFIRLIRIAAVLISLLTPAIYIAITNYHQEMIPTDLLLAISSTRERVPFPILFEVVGMELAFEIIRECSIRIPTNIGSTIGIVGTLILGQAAVEANIVSPILVIIIALTGVSSFAVSNIDLNMSIRISRFFFTFCSIMMGFLGLAIGITTFGVYVISIKSFGVPFFAPVIPYYESSRDMAFRSTVKRQWLKALYAKSKLKYKKTPSEEE